MWVSIPRSGDGAPSPALVELRTRIADGLQRLVLVLISGTGMALAYPLVIPQVSPHQIDAVGHLEWLSWIILVPLLIALERAARIRSAFASGWLAGVAFMAVLAYCLPSATVRATLQGPAVAWGITGVVLTVTGSYWAVACTIAWVLWKRLRWPWWTHLPWIWVATDFLRNFLFGGFPIGSLGYVQVRHVLISQLASLVGLYGIAALVVGVNCVCRELLGALVERRKVPWLVIIGCCGVLIGVLVFGMVHLGTLRRRSAVASTLRATIIQPNVNQAMKQRARSQSGYIFQRLVPPTLEAIRHGTDVVIWPESTWPIPLPRELTTLADSPGGNLALGHAHMILGAVTMDVTAGKMALRNSLLLVKPDLSFGGEYSKQHLLGVSEYVPWWLRLLWPQVAKELVEAVAGESHVFEIATPRGTAAVGPLLCWDAMFPELARTYSRTGVNALLVATNESWFGYTSGPYLALSCSRMRAIEVGKAVIRASYAGPSGLVLPTGELAPGTLDVGPVGGNVPVYPEEPAAVFRADVPLLREGTIYSQIGDVFAWACVIFTLSAAVNCTWRVWVRRGS